MNCTKCGKLIRTGNLAETPNLAKCSFHHVNKCNDCCLPEDIAQELITAGNNLAKGHLPRSSYFNHLKVMVKLAESKRWLITDTHTG